MRISKKCNLLAAFVILSEELRSTKREDMIQQFSEKSRGVLSCFRKCGRCHPNHLCMNQSSNLILQMTKEEFDARMAIGLSQAKADQSSSASEVFERLRADLGASMKYLGPEETTGEQA